MEYHLTAAEAAVMYVTKFIFYEVIIQFINPITYSILTLLSNKSCLFIFIF